MGRRTERAFEYFPALFTNRFVFGAAGKVDKSLVDKNNSVVPVDDAHGMHQAIHYITELYTVSFAFAVSYRCNTRP